MPADYRIVEGNTRKRQKISPAISLPGAIEPQIGAMPAPISVSSGRPEVIPEKTPCIHEAALQSLQLDLGAMRDLITCRSCYRFLYEPYSLSCGHTFCYTCLDQWMVQNRNKTCPDCRCRVKDEPTPSYLIREMVLVFISRKELLPAGETPEEHERLAKEEAEAVSIDKANTDSANGGLFKGSFRRRANKLIAFRDHEDNVWRCPNCHHEIEDGWCNACGARVYEDSDEADEADELDLSVDDDSEAVLSEELDHELDYEDMDAEEQAALVDMMRRREFMDYEAGVDGSGDEDDSDSNAPPWGPSGIDYDEDDEDEEDDSQMEGFIVDDDEEEDDEGAGNVEDAEISSDSDDESVVPISAHRRLAGRSTRPLTINDSDDEDEDEENEAGLAHNPIHVDEEDEDEDENSEDENSEDGKSEDDSESEDGEPSEDPHGIWSSLQDSMDEEEGYEHGHEHVYDYGQEGDSGDTARWGDE